MIKQLTDDAEILFRQIHPNFWQDGEPSSQPFMPTPKDKNQLSIDRSTLTTAAGSFALFAGNGHATKAVYGLTVGEFRILEIDCQSDPLPPTEFRSANPAHASADYSAHGGNQQKTKAKRLKQNAIARGQLHP